MKAGSRLELNVMILTDSNVTITTIFIVHGFYWYCFRNIISNFYAMESRNKHPQPLINWTSLKSYKDEVTYNKVRRHLIDINDTISEDDIRNIKIHELVHDAVTLAKHKYPGIVK